MICTHSDDDISCLSHSNQLLGIGLRAGSVMVYRCNFDKQQLVLEQLYYVFNDVVS